MKKLSVLNLSVAAASAGCLLLAWTAAYFSVGNGYIVPSPAETFAEIGRLLGEGAFWSAFAGTLLRALWSFLLSFALGVAAALSAAVLPPLRSFFAPVVSVLRTVPTMAVTLILLLWTSPATAPAIIAVLVLFPVFYASVLAALDGVRGEYGELAASFGVGKLKQAAQMYLPLAAPPVLSQLGAVYSLGLKITVSGEVLSATAKSLGSMMQQAQAFYLMPRLIALTCLAVAAGFFFEGAFYLAARLIKKYL